MPLKFTTDPKALMKRLKNAVIDIPTIAGAEAERFFKQSFRSQGWNDKVFTPWKARKGQRTRTIGEQRGGRNILIKTGALRRSIRVVKRGRFFVVVGTSLPYAKIHNEGGVIKKRVRVSSHLRKTKGGETIVMDHSRNMNTTIPKRRYMGNSSELNYLIGKVIRNKVKNIGR